MADPDKWWEAAPLFEPPKAAAPKPASPEGEWWKEAPAEPSKAFKGAILPLSADESGKLGFDSDAGILGSVKRSLTLPGRVYAGEIDPMSDEGIAQAGELAGLASPVNPAVRAGGHAIPGTAAGLERGKVATPTAEALKAAAEAGYDKVRDMGVDYSSKAVANTAADIMRTLEQDGILGELAPKTFAILKRLSSPPEGSVATSAGIEAARRSLGRARKDFTNPTEQEAAGRVVEQLDRFVGRPDPSSVVAGPAAAAGKELDNARKNYAAAKRSDKLSGIEERAELNAAVAGSGRNTDNAIRQRTRDIITKPKESAGFTPTELAALEGVARGNSGRNALRTIGNIFGGGGGLGSLLSGSAGAGAGAMTGIGAAMGLPWLGPVFGAAALPAIGVGAKTAGNRLTARALNKVDEATRQRSPLYEEAVRDTPMVGRRAFDRALDTGRGASAMGNRGAQEMTPEDIDILLKAIAAGKGA